MKKSILLTFVLAAGFVATFLTGCGSDPAPTCNSITGRDTGSHVIYFGSNTNSLLPLISDTLDAVAINGDSVTIKSKALGNKTLTGKLDPNNCNKIILDSFVVGDGPSDTLKIPTATLPIDGGLVKIWNVRAGGSGEITANGAKTQLNIVKGKTNIVIGPIDFTTIPNALGPLSLRGTFLKLP